MLPCADHGYGCIEGVTVQIVPATRLDDIIGSVDRVDLIDMDIQGAEADIIEASFPTLRAKVRRLHIGTHSTEVENRIRSILGANGWRCRWDFSCNSTVRTPYGKMRFQDGVQAWSNPKLR